MKTIIEFTDFTDDVNESERSEKKRMEYFSKHIEPLGLRYNNKEGIVYLRYDKIINMGIGEIFDFSFGLYEIYWKSYNIEDEIMTYVVNLS